jgi:glycosyltransferase involved in cell wall biosynthesis
MKIIFLDTAYTLKMARARVLDQEFISRQCGDYFEHVWAINPIADIQDKNPLKFEGFKVDIVSFTERQTIIEGVTTYYKILKKIAPLNFVVSQLRLLLYTVKLARVNKVNFICCTDPYFVGIFGVLLKFFIKAKLVIWVLGNYDDIYDSTGTLAMPRLFKRRWVEKIVERFVFKNSDLIAGGNHDCLQFVLNNGVPKKKTTLFPIGKLISRAHQIDPIARPSDIFFERKKDVKVFIFIGRLLKIKFPDHTIFAFTEIHKSYPNAELIMAGDGEMRSELLRICSNFGILNKVHFLGDLDQDRLANLMASCFACLSPLSGRSLVEVSLAGLPVIAYDRDWQSDYLLASGAGMIVPFLDWKAMGAAAINLLNSPDSADAMAQCARKRGLDFTDLDVIYSYEKSQYSKLLI